MSQSNIIDKIAIVGAGGQIGGAFAQELLRTGKHTITAITRADSKSTIPSGAKVVRVNLEDESSLVSALKGQQFLIITLSVRAAPDTHSTIVQAAAKAGVPYVMPNIYGYDLNNAKLNAESLYGNGAVEKCEEITRLGMTYVTMCCGFWYELSLALGEDTFGFDIKNRKVLFFDDGKTPISVSTWDQCGRAVGALLSLPTEGASPSVADWKNKQIMVASWTISQRDMLDSLNRVLGTTDEDWEITSVPTAERYQKAMEALKKGEQTGFVQGMYSRVLFPTGDGNYEASKGLDNTKLGLPKEDLDAATKRVVGMVESGWNPYA